MVCGTKCTGYLHMNERWLWRYFILDTNGNIAAMSSCTYFSRGEAEAALMLLLN